MNEVSKIVMLEPSKLKPYERNARKHGGEDVEAIAESIRQFGFNDPIGIWGCNNIVVEGHGRLMAAKKLGLKKVPCIRLDHLSDEQRKAYALAHNRSAELSSWNDELVKLEIESLGDFDFEAMGFDISFGGVPEVEEDSPADWFEREELDGDALEEGNDEYSEFVEKFKPKKTTDDCYTPQNVYDAIAEWVAEEYGLDKVNFVRPFYPGGDYQAEEYKPDDIVVDNPPFSILGEILKFYVAKGVKFFLLLQL